MTIIDVSTLIDEEQTSNRGSKCATCAWLNTREPGEQARWDEEMARSVEERQHASIYRAMEKAAQMTQGKAPPSVSSVRKHRAEKHRS